MMSALLFAPMLAAAVADGVDACGRLFVRPDAAPVDVVVEREEHAVSLATHDAHLGPPALVDIAGVEVVGRRIVRSAQDDDGRATRRATVEVEPALAHVCPPGRYELQVGDAIGEDLQVVAILREGVLLAHGDALAFATFPGRRAPAFRLVWSSSYEVFFPPAAVSPSPAKPPPKTARGRKRR